MIHAKHNISPLNPYGHLKFTHYSKNGVIKEERTEIMHSFVRTYFDIMKMFIRGNRIGNFPNIGGGSSSVADNANKFTNANAGADYKGIFVGNGNTVFSIDDTQLDSIITHGTGGGQLEYGACTATVPSNPRIGQLSRTFTNSSGSQISVNEIGLGFREGSESSTTNPIMIARDVLGSSFDIADGEALKVDYEFGVTEGAINIKFLSHVFVTGSSYPSGFINWQSYDGRVYEDDAPTIFVDSAIWNGESHPKGIVLGTGDTPISPNDEDLDSKIGIGNGSGELNKSPQQVTYDVDSQNNKITLKIEGEFSNNSGSGITVREIGWYTDFEGQGQFLFWRKVLPEPITIIAGSTKVARITLNYSA